LHNAKSSADTAPRRAGDVVAVPYVGASDERRNRPRTKLTEQFHLSRLQVINWGVFDGAWRVHSLAR